MTNTLLQKQYANLKAKYKCVSMTTFFTQINDGIPDKHYKAYLEMTKEKLLNGAVDENLLEELSTVYKDIPSLSVRIIPKLDYPFSSPLLRINKPYLFHPNIDEEGNIRLEILSSWSVANSLLELVQAVEKVLIEPNLNPINIANSEAAKEYENDKVSYYLKAIDIALNIHETNFPDFKNESF
jgi:ubiquitin-protein ligase